MFRPENGPKRLLLSITENCTTLIEQTQTKPKETLEVELSLSHHSSQSEDPG